MVCVQEVHSTHAWGRLQEQALVALEELGSLLAAMHTVVRPALQAAKERRATVAQVGDGMCHCVGVCMTLSLVLSLSLSLAEAG